MSAICIEHVCERITLSIRVILSCPILCPYMCPHIYGTTAACLPVMLSCLVCQKECTDIQALSESPLEVCILTRRVVTLCPWLHCFRVLVEFELYHHQNWGVMWIPYPWTNTPRENVETRYTFQTSFLEAMLGELGRLSCLETRHGAFSTFPPTDLPRRIYRLADSPQRDVGRPRWMVL